MALKVTGKKVGRPVGSTSKFHSIRQAFVDAFNGMGGMDALLDWGRQPRHRRDFYLIIAKMLPREVEISGKDGVPLMAPAIIFSGVETEHGSADNVLHATQSTAGVGTAKQI